MRHRGILLQEDAEAAKELPKDDETDTETASEPEPATDSIQVAELDPPTAKDALKTEIADGLAGAKPDKAVLGEILLKLESQNPTASPASSPLLNGRWKFLYASGSSPGLKALQLLLRGSALAPKSPSGADIVDVADTYLTISPDQPRAMSEVKFRVLSFENTIKLASKLDMESPVRLLESYDFAQSEYLDLKVPFQSPVEYKRSVLISYLDEELMVTRDENGRPDVLMRIEEAKTEVESADDTSKEEEAPDYD